MKKLFAGVLALVSFSTVANAGICDALIPKISGEYYYTDLEWLRNGNPHVTETLVSCIYKATKPTLESNLPVMLIVTMNMTDGRYTVEER